MVISINKSKEDILDALEEYCNDKEEFDFTYAKYGAKLIHFGGANKSRVPIRCIIENTDYTTNVKLKLDYFSMFLALITIWVMGLCMYFAVKSPIVLCVYFIMTIFAIVKVRTDLEDYFIRIKKALENPKYFK